ncbi:MAG: alkaline phosphatase [Ignavibacteriaceae bacterium]
MKLYFLLLLLLLYVQPEHAQEDSRPENIILLIGDGMGINYVAASVLSMENDPFRKFDITGFSITSSADKLITDSAAGATAIATGYRTNNYFIGVDTLYQPLYSFFSLAESLNKSTGLVATSTITHATPASFVANVNNRADELEIARQMIYKDLEVVIGGGKKFFLPLKDNGSREDDQNLIDSLKNSGYNFINSFPELVSDTSDDKFFAILSLEGLPKASERDYSLGTLTSIALKKLSSDPDGFVLMVEGSQIDWAGHYHETDYLLNELSDFNTAINTALDFAIEDKNTLVIVTADHETGGMAITAGEKDGSELEIKYLTGGHTAGLVGVFAYGPGAEKFSGVYDNYILGRKIFYLLKPDFLFSD